MFTLSGPAVHDVFGCIDMDAAMFLLTNVNGNDDSFKMHLPETKSIKELMNRVAVADCIWPVSVGIHRIHWHFGMFQRQMGATYTMSEIVHVEHLNG